MWYNNIAFCIGMQYCKGEFTNMNEHKKKALDLALSQIEKQFGKGAVMMLGETPAQSVDVIRSGCASLDFALGVGGYPKGRIIEIFGPESSGKTTLALHAIAETQKADGVAAFIDAEHALDPLYARNLGVNLDSLIIAQPDTGEQALEITEGLVRSGAVDMIVIDSVAALVPKAEIDGEMGSSHVGLHARLMSQALRKLAGVINKSNTTVIFINQLREKVGIIYGNPEVTTGGRALKFYSTIRIDIRRIESIKTGNDIVGNRTRARIVKNKVAPPFKECTFEIIFGKGISYEADIANLAVNNGIIEKSGSWFSYKGMRLQGMNSVKAALSDDKKLLQEIVLALQEKIAPAHTEVNTENNTEEAM